MTDHSLSSFCVTSAALHEMDVVYPVKPWSCEHVLQCIGVACMRWSPNMSWDTSHAQESWIPGPDSCHHVSFLVTAEVLTTREKLAGLISCDPAQYADTIQKHNWSMEPHWGVALKIPHIPWWEFFPMEVPGSIPEVAEEETARGIDLQCLKESGQRLGWIVRNLQEMKLKSGDKESYRREIWMNLLKWVPV